MKKFTQTMNIAKQATLEKLGKAEAKADSEEALKAKEDLTTLKHNYQEMGSALKKYCNEGASLAYSQSGVLSESLSIFAAKEEGTVLGSLLQEIARGQKSNTESWLTWLNLTKEKWTAPVLALIDSDLKRAKDLKDKQESARMKLDIAMNELASQQKKGGPKVAQAEADNAAAKDKYDAATREMTQFMEGLHERIHRELAHQLKLYAEAQLEYFTQGVNVWKSALDAFGDLESSTSSSSTTASI